MRCLWLTWIDPAPEHDGQRIYSGRMIDAVAARGVGIDILCFHSELHRARGDPDDIVRWWLVPREERPGWWSVFSRLPNLSHRCDTQAMRRRFRELLRQRDWDTIVMDGLSTGWALDPIAAHYGDRGDRPRLIYISHNHEETTRALVAENFKGNPLMAAALRIDARKATLLEHRMMDEVDVISAVTPEDAEQFALRVANKPVFRSLARLWRTARLRAPDRWTASAPRAARRQLRMAGEADEPHRISDGRRSHFRHRRRRNSGRG